MRVYKTVFKKLFCKNIWSILFFILHLFQNNFKQCIMKPSKDKLVKCLKTNIELFNRYNSMCLNKGCFVDLSYVDLSRADLSYVNLSYVNLRGSNLRGAILIRADLSFADLSFANLSFANLSFSDLSFADLSRADLSRANLSRTYLIGANLSRADLSFANLSDVDLSFANLDFSSMSLWCGDLKANYDNKQIIQQLYHVLSHAKNSNNITDELKSLLLTDDLKKQANKFHRVDECGEI